MPRKYEVIDEIIRYELRQFLLWLEEEKKIELCEQGDYAIDEMFGYVDLYYPIHKAPEDLINEYMEIK